MREEPELSTVVLTSKDLPSPTTIKFLTEELATNVVIDYIAINAYNVRMMPHETPFMATLTIRNVEPAVKEQLRVRAARNGRSMEAELRAIVTDAVGREHGRETNLAEAIRRRFEPFGGVDDLEPQPPVTVGEPPAFDP